MAHKVFRHMSPKDEPLFATYFLTQEGQGYTAWEFDVLVGDPEEPGPMWPMSLRRQALYLNALRIDAVGWFFQTPTLIECKPNGGLAGIGQLLGYQEWYRIIFGAQPSMLYVCQRMSRQIKTLCEIKQIAYRIVIPADPLDVARAEAEVQGKIQNLSILPQLNEVA